jgi:hypothetical protein
MAKIETVNVNNYIEKQVNLSDIVGLHQTNERNDVMAIQALFNLVGSTDHWSRKLIGVARAELPKISGIFCTDTWKAVSSFQRTMAAKLLSVDGKIHPGHYKGRIIKVNARTNTKYMTITLLNLYAIDGALGVHSLDVISAIRKIAPNLVYQSFS